MEELWIKTWLTIKRQENIPKNLIEKVSIRRSKSISKMKKDLNNQVFRTSDFISIKIIKRYFNI